MTGRTCQMLFAACSQELKNNLFGLLSSAYARKPTKLQTFKFWNVRTLWLNVLISTICLRLSSVKCVCVCQMQSAPVLWVVGNFSWFTREGCSRARQGGPETDFQDATQPQGGVQLITRCYTQHQKWQEISLHPRLLHGLEICSLPPGPGSRAAFPYN